MDARISLRVGQENCQKIQEQKRGQEIEGLLHFDLISKCAHSKGKSKADAREGKRLDRGCRCHYD